jgi:hypothetical protein
VVGHSLAAIGTAISIKFSVRPAFDEAKKSGCDLLGSGWWGHQPVFAQGYLQTGLENRAGHARRLGVHETLPVPGTDLLGIAEAIRPNYWVWSERIVHGIYDLQQSARGPMRSSRLRWRGSAEKLAGNRG